MHPIERLRYVARVSGVSQAMLVREAAGALASFSYEPHGLVTACRRMISRHPVSGPLVGLSARVLSASEPIEEPYQCMGAPDDDTTTVQQGINNLRGFRLGSRPAHDGSPVGLSGLHAARNSCICAASESASSVRTRSSSSAS